MRIKNRAILPLFRSDAQARVLATLYLARDGESRSLSRLAEASGVTPSQAHREVRRLEDGGLVVSERVGNVRLVSVNRESPYHEEVRSLILKAFGPAEVLREVLAAVEGVQAAYIFGSWARRYLGEPGDAPGDIDVLVIGHPDVDAVYAAVAVAEQRLARPVNPTIVSIERWANPNSGFLKTVRDQPIVPVLGR